MHTNTGISEYVTDLNAAEDIFRYLYKTTAAAVSYGKLGKGTEEISKGRKTQEKYQLKIFYKICIIQYDLKKHILYDLLRCKLVTYMSSPTHTLQIV